jgi:hypothetical protein
LKSHREVQSVAGAHFVDRSSGIQQFWDAVMEARAFNYIEHGTGRVTPIFGHPAKKIAQAS